MSAYTFTPCTAETLEGLVSIPSHIVPELLARLFENTSEQGIIDVFANFIAMSVSVVENNSIVLHRVLKDHGVVLPEGKKVTLPSLQGALAGLRLAAPDQSKTCNDCACRIGTPPNQSSPTVYDVIDCVRNGLVFYCHNNQNILDVKPKKACVGWSQLRKAQL